MYTGNQWVKYWNSRTQWVPRRPPQMSHFVGTAKKFYAPTSFLPNLGPSLRQWSWDGGFAWFYKCRYINTV